MNLRHPLARVKGLGASGEGSHHFWHQRVTAIALVPLTLWFVFSILGHIGGDYRTVTAWVAQPGVALALILYFVCMFYHAQLGLQVVIEDYVHTEWVRLVALLSMKALFIVTGAAAILAVLRIAL